MCTHIYIYIYHSLIGMCSKIGNIIHTCMKLYVCMHTIILCIIYVYIYMYYENTFISLIGRCSKITEIQTSTHRPLIVIHEWAWARTKKSSAASPVSSHCCSVLQCVAVCCSVLQCVCRYKCVFAKTFWAEFVIGSQITSQTHIYINIHTATNCHAL